MRKRTPLRHGGLALATSCAALVNVWLLVRWLGVDLRGIIDRALIRLLVESLILAAVMGVVCWLGWRWLAPTFLASGFGMQAPIMLGLVVAGALVYALGAKLLRVPEMSEAVRMVLRK